MMIEQAKLYICYSKGTNKYITYQQRNIVLKVKSSDQQLNFAKLILLLLIFHQSSPYLLLQCNSPKCHPWQNMQTDFADIFAEMH